MHRDPRQRPVTAGEKEAGGAQGDEKQAADRPGLADEGGKPELARPAGAEKTTPKSPGDQRQGQHRPAAAHATRRQPNAGSRAKAGRSGRRKMEPVAAGQGEPDEGGERSRPGRSARRGRCGPDRRRRPARRRPQPETRERHQERRTARQNQTGCLWARFPGDPAGRLAPEDGVGGTRRPGSAGIAQVAIAAPGGSRAMPDHQRRRPGRPSHQRDRSRAAGRGEDDLAPLARMPRPRATPNSPQVPRLSPPGPQRRQKGEEDGGRQVRRMSKMTEVLKKSQKMPPSRSQPACSPTLARPEAPGDGPR